MILYLHQAPPDIGHFHFRFVFLIVQTANNSSTVRYGLGMSTESKYSSAVGHARIAGKKTAKIVVRKLYLFPLRQGHYNTKNDTKKENKNHYFSATIKTIIYYLIKAT